MGKSILIIEDEELVTKSLLKLLSAEGYKVMIARSGSEGIEKVKDTEFDLIISDVRMPQMDGIETIMQIRQIRSKANKNQIPEVIITGYADKEKFEAAMDLKVADYLYKPFDKEEFLKVVKRTIG
jgi:CheY-like chemotaxis protein